MIVLTRTGRHRAVTGRAGGIGAVPLRRTRPGRAPARVWPLLLTLSLLTVSTLAGSGLGAWLG